MSTLDNITEQLASHKTILLIVEVNNAEEADEILQWMYSKTRKPMKATLREIAWDKRIVSLKEYEAIEAVKRILS